MESQNLASNDQPSLGDCSVKANTPLNEGVSAASLLNVGEVGMDALSGVVTTPAPLPRSTGAGLRKKRFPDRVLVSTYVPPLERVHPSTVKGGFGSRGRAESYPPLEPLQLGGISGYAYG